MTVTDGRVVEPMPGTVAVPDRLLPCADEVDDFDMRHLRYFLAVVRAGTVSAAAQELRISQPSLSQQIRRLERKVGSPLFLRSSRGVELTASGKAFLREVQTIPAQLRGAIAAAAPTPEICSVGVCGGIPAGILTEVQHAFSAPGGAARLRMRALPVAEQTELLRHGEIDFGLARLPLPAGDLMHATVRNEPLGLVMHGSHPLAALAAPTWDDLVRYRLLWYAAGCAPGYAETVPAQLAALGWSPALHAMDHGDPALFAHELEFTSDLVSLRPQRILQGQLRLAWRPLPTAAPPRERIALTALVGSRQAHLLRRVAARMNWPISD
jgi:DNA-binding transcriptional LysR family regulator